MKRIFYFLVLGIALCACEPTPTSINNAGTVDTTSVNAASVDGIVKFEFEGHEYIDFKYWETNGYGAHMQHSVVHNPNCKYCAK